MLRGSIFPRTPDLDPAGVPERPRRRIILSRYAVWCLVRPRPPRIAVVRLDFLEVRRFFLVVGLLPIACARDNPAFDRTSPTSSGASAGGSTGIASGTRGVASSGDDRNGGETSTRTSTSSSTSSGTGTRGDGTEADGPTVVDVGGQCRSLDPSMTACNLLDPAGCPPGKTCRPVGSEAEGLFAATRCVEVAGDVEAGGLCESACFPSSGIDDCRPDSFCLQDANGPGRCVPLCTSTRQCTGDDECVVFDAPAKVGFCARPCHPFNEQVPPCLNPDICVGGPEGFHCMPHAGSDGMSLGQPCTQPFECPAGQMCSDSPVVNCQADRCCTRLCDLRLPKNSCPSGRCVEHTSDPPRQFMNVGVCVP